MNSDYKELLRKIVLRILINHPIKGLSVTAMRLSLLLKQELPEETFSVNEHDILEALSFLKGVGFASAEYDKLGSTMIWKPTSDGILFHERNQ